MPWELDNKRSIYGQIIEKIKSRIVTGKYPPGEKLPSVRDLADEAGVNPNTMQRALSELERTGVIYSQRTSGRFVTEDENMIQNLKEAAAKEAVDAFLEKIRELGLDIQTVLSMIQRTAGGEQNERNI